MLHVLIFQINMSMFKRIPFGTCCPYKNECKICFLALKEGEQSKPVHPLTAAVINKLIFCCGTAVGWFLPHRIYQAS